MLKAKHSTVAHLVRPARREFIFIGIDSAVELKRQWSAPNLPLTALERTINYYKWQI